MAAERIDVRALIKKAADVLDEDYFQMAAVEAAVAELLEADKEYDAALTSWDALLVTAAKQRRAAALARMGEGA